MKALVTGGGGFLGRAIVEELVARGHQVRSISRSPAPELAALGVEHVQCDLLDKKNMRAVSEGYDTLFHVAAKTGVWGRRREYELANVEGTRNAVATAQVQRMSRFVHTSTPSVVFDGRGHLRADNDLPYAKRFLCAYAATKAIAERDVLFANGRYGLATIALRPHLIFGPRDPQLVPRVVRRAREGKLAIVGRGDNEVTLAFVENVAAAHVLAAERLTPDAPHAGRAYFLGEPEPVELWPWLAELLRRIDLPPPTRRISAGAAYALGAALEALWTIARRRDEPPMTRFVARQLATSHSYSLEPARRDFGYEPRVSMADALDRTVAWLRGSAEERTTPTGPAR